MSDGSYEQVHALVTEIDAVLDKADATYADSLHVAAHLLLDALRILDSTKRFDAAESFHHTIIESLRNG